MVIGEGDERDGAGARRDRDVDGEILIDRVVAFGHGKTAGLGQLPIDARFEASVAAVLSGLLGDDRNDRNGEEPGAQP